MTKTYLRDKKFSNGFKGGDCTDVSPDSWGVLDRMTKYLDRSGGTGLVIGLWTIIYSRRYSE